MRIQRSHLTVLLNQLYDRDEWPLSVGHPSEEVGELLTIEAGEGPACTVSFSKDREAYRRALAAVRRAHPGTVSKDLPSPQEYLNTLVASGIVELENLDEVRTFVEQYGDPDLTAGHPPVFAGFDTNLMAWRLDEVLGLRDPDAGVGYVNGFVLAEGVRDELQWDKKCHDQEPFVDAFGDAFDEYWNQPLGDVRIGRLGYQQYREIRDIEQATEVASERGDETIVKAYAEYSEGHRGRVMLFSNDRNFVELARGHTILAQHVDLPRDLPDAAPADWHALERLLYTMAVVFGVITVPTATIHGVWSGKDGLDWQRERVKVNCRSPPVERGLTRDLSIVEAHDEVSDR